MTTRKCQGSKPGRRTRGGQEVVVGLALAHRPLEERVLDDLVDRGVLLGRRLADRVALGEGALLDLRALGEGEHPAGPADLPAELLQQPVAGRALGDRAADHGAAELAGARAHPGRERRTDPAAAVRRVHGRVAATRTR